MPKQLLLVFALLFQTLASDAQIVTKVYHGATWSCSFYFTTNTDYILELFNDSSIQLSAYTSTTADIFPPSANTFSGTYSLNDNKMKITFVNKNMAQGRGLHQDSLFVKNHIPNLPPPVTFIITDSTIQSPEGLIPMLHTSSISVSTKLKNDFEKKLKPATFSIPKKVSSAKRSLMQ